MLRGIEVERRAPAEVVQGEEAFVELLVVTNHARGVRLGLTLDDPHIAPTSLYLTQVPPGERVELVTVRPATQAGRAGRRRWSRSVPRRRSASPNGAGRSRVAGSTIVLPAVIPLGRCRS